MQVMPVQTTSLVNLQLLTACAVLTLDVYTYWNRCSFSDFVAVLVTKTPCIEQVKFNKCSCIDLGGCLERFER